MYVFKQSTSGLSIPTDSGVYGIMKSLGNTVYYRRFIILEMNERTVNSPDRVDNVVVINISASRGKGLMCLQKDSQGHQSTNYYHCKGIVWRRSVNPGEKLIADRDLFLDSKLEVDDISFGRHQYDMGRHNELSIHTSYNELLTKQDPKYYGKSPNVRFYNNEHHEFMQYNTQQTFINGDTYLHNFLNTDNTFKDFVSLRELIDDHTVLMMTRDSDIDRLSLQDGVVNTPGFEFQIDDLYDCSRAFIVGAVLDLATEMNVTHLWFRYSTKLGMSDVKYETYHNLPKVENYIQQIFSSSVTSFMESMSRLREIINGDFELFIAMRMGNVKIQLIKVGFNGKPESSEFTYDLGLFRNEHHDDSMSRYTYAPY